MIDRTIERAVRHAVAKALIPYSVQFIEVEGATMDTARDEITKEVLLALAHELDEVLYIMDEKCPHCDVLVRIKRTPTMSHKTCPQCGLSWGVKKIETSKGRAHLVARV